jgi:hypothetical protein
MRSKIFAVIFSCVAWFPWATTCGDGYFYSDSDQQCMLCMVASSTLSSLTDPADTSHIHGNTLNATLTTYGTYPDDLWKGTIVRLYSGKSGQTGYPVNPGQTVESYLQDPGVTDLYFNLATCKSCTGPAKADCQHCADGFYPPRSVDSANPCTSACGPAKVYDEAPTQTCQFCSGYYGYNGLGCNSEYAGVGCAPIPSKTACQDCNGITGMSWANWTQGNGEEYASYCTCTEG